MNWEKLARAEAHPIRLRVIEKIEDEPRKEGWSPVALRRELDIPLADLAYHVRRLYSIGLLVPVGTRPRRGAVEHLYALAPDS